VKTNLRGNAGGKKRRGGRREGGWVILKRRESVEENWVEEKSLSRADGN
jgi:hypothetical protein